jgi:two-component system chemotaxis response regulator CheY
VMSPEAGVRAHFRDAAASLAVPLEVVEVSDAAAACRCLPSGIDLAYLDGAAPPDQLGRVIAAARAAAKPPFTMQLAVGAAISAFEADGLAGKPSRAEEAKRLLDRSMRVRLPSHVLVVDDSSTMRTIVRKTLAATRFPLDISEAEEGFAALKLVGEGDVHIVFLDYNMPGFSGLETLAEFKREQRNLTVVMMTSAATDELEDRARALGASFLKKPFFPTDIEAVLSSFYGLRALNPKRA